MKIYDALKDLISAEMISKASATLGESNPKTSAAVSAVLPSLLGKLIKIGETPRLAEVAEFAGKKNVIGQIGDIFAGHGIFDSVNVGERFENALLGDENSAFASAIASKAGVKKESADRLTSWVAGVIAAFFGDKMVNGNQSMASLISQLGKEKDALGAAIPSGIASSLGLASLFGTQVDAKVVNPVKPAAVKMEEKAKEGGNGWIIWLIIILLLLLLLFFWWKSCSKHKAETYGIRNAVESVEDNARKIIDEAGKDARELAEDLEKAALSAGDAVENVVNRIRREMTLPDGNKITVYKGGSEERMIVFLNSDEYKNATEEQLKNKWFEFDNIDFEFGSSTKLMDGAQGQLNNIVAILKNYPNAKIRLGGYADKIGNDQDNLKLSEARANHIKSVMEKQGISANRVITQGFGEEFAKYPADAPDSLRRHDREIALRFVK